MNPSVILDLAPLKLKPMAKHTLLNIPAMGFILKLFEAIPIKRSKNMKMINGELREQEHKKMFF
jgi:1-acyl-sn-glycerol-3-phosphate acyltransferase